MEEFERHNRMLLKLMIFFATFIVVKDLIIFAWAGVVFYNTYSLYALFLAVLSLGISILFMNLRGKMVKWLNGEGA